jgi:type II secretory ATPase GspE/PulE/Tfp pilus assembly ATPase PilB-like protein
MVRPLDVRSSLAAMLNIVLSQRLSPRLCQTCKEPRSPTDKERAMFVRFGLPVPQTIYRRRGCPECGTGIRGRVPVFEQVTMSGKLRDIMAAGKDFSTEAFRQQWLAEGGCPMGRFALQLVAEGLVEYEEAKCHMVWVPEAP